jgi:dolichol-phosphate mannosyltransferase
MAHSRGGAGVTSVESELRETLAERERLRDTYWDERDPIADDRLRWRAHSFRHTVHCLPGQEILELGSGSGRFTRALVHATRGENPITAVRFQDDGERPRTGTEVEHVCATDLDAIPVGKQFAFIVGNDLLDRRSTAAVLQLAHELLAPGGELVVYESNPWNPLLELRRVVLRLVGRPDPRCLLNRTQLYEQVSEIGFVRVFAVFNDFLYAPLTRSLVWMLRDVSVLLENAPGVRTLAGSILLHAQRPPRRRPSPAVSLCEHAALHRRVSIVVPCHDEEHNVEPLVQELLALYGDYVHEIVLVEDNSRDRTRDVILALAAREPRVRPILRDPPGGVGLALRDGLRAATGKWVLTLDCDFLHLCPELRDLFDAAASGYDVAVGSRFSRQSVLLNYPFAKIVANRAFHWLARIVFWRRFRDLTNNLKLMRREVVEELDLHEPGFAVNAETGLQPLLGGWRFLEVPISWVGRTSDQGTSSFRLARVGRGYARVLWHLWLARALRGGRYRRLARRFAAQETVRQAEPAAFPTTADGP